MEMRTLVWTLKKRSAPVPWPESQEIEAVKQRADAPSQPRAETPETRRRCRAREANRRRRWNPLNQYSAIAPTLADPLAPPYPRFFTLSAPSVLLQPSFSSAFRSWHATLRSTPVTLSGRNFSGFASTGYSRREFAPAWGLDVYPPYVRQRLASRRR